MATSSFPLAPFGLACLCPHEIADMDSPTEPLCDNLINCSECGGIGSILIRCSCSRTAGLPVIDSTSITETGAPFPDCRMCKGSGTTSLPCNGCAGAGTIRLQVVYTVLNLGSGAVASATLIPGAIDPIPSPGGNGASWELPTSELVDRLIAQVGGTLDRSHYTADLYRKNLPLPGWTPDMPLAQRLRIEAAAIARTQTLTRHRHFFTTATPPKSSYPADRLRSLARLADLLHLDLYCLRYPASGSASQQGHPAWAVAFALPTDDALLPAAPDLANASLADAVAAVDPIAMLRKAHRDFHPSRPAPAHFIAPARQVPEPGPAGADLTELSEQLTMLAEEDAGALALRRNGSWHTARFTRSGTTDDFVETATGQLRRTTSPIWRSDTALPPPAWRGKAIPELTCLHCETGTTWAPCDCTGILTDRADPTCDACGGTGARQSTTCRDCGRVGRIRYGYTVTVTDLDTFARHWNFDPRAGADPRPRPWPPYGELDRHQLPEPDRLVSRLFESGIDYADVRTFDDLAPSADLIDGAVLAPPGTSQADVVQTHARAQAANRPGARITLIWHPPASATVLQATRIAWGLGFDLVIGVEDRTTAPTTGTALGGMRWGAALIRPSGDMDRTRTSAFGRPTLTAALQECLDHLPHQVNIARVHKPGALEVIPAPQQPEPPHPKGTERLEVTLSRLAAAHRNLPEPPVVVRLSPNQVTVTRLTAGTEHHLQLDAPLAQAPTLVEALAILASR
jgi:hypothetical protein